MIRSQGSHRSTILLESEDTALEHNVSHFDVDMRFENEDVVNGGTVLQGLKSTWLERVLIQKILKYAGCPALFIKLWDGSIVQASEKSCSNGLLIPSRKALLKLILSPDRYLLEGLTNGELQVEGDLTQFLTDLNRSFRPQWTMRSRLYRWSASHSLRSCRKQIAQHYDLGNDFYKLWLDKQLLYTCAYFPNPEMSLEEAQIAKMDHVCRKLQLTAGQEVIEAGCGWGALAIHMAQHYGVKVKAYNISHEQIVFARDRAQLEGVHQQVEFIEDDWREIKDQCDAFVSVGMLEHVGVVNFQRFGEVINHSLRPNGRGLVHSIAVNQPQAINRWIEQNIFPGAEPPALSEFVQLFESAGLVVFDLENLRQHYAMTLRHWLNRFEAHAEEVQHMYDEQFTQMWRVYLAASQASFASDSLQLYQLLVHHRTATQLPMSRKWLYPESTTSETSVR